jgi:hypothetical protein
MADIGSPRGDGDVIEYLVGYRVENNAIQYRVHWKGTSDSLDEVRNSNIQPVLV